MSQMTIMDLYCGAGGASMGLHRAFPDARIIGVDIVKQPRYPFCFRLADALEVDLSAGTWFWASPPCQRYSSGAGKWGTQGNHPDLIDATRKRLQREGRPYVIENIVPAAGKLVNPVMLCGTMFGLGVFRHRLFETSFPVTAPEHPRHTGRIGDGRYHTVTGHAGGSSKRDGWKNGGTAEWRVAMGIDWMTGNELAESIPPAYAEWIGNQWNKLFL